MEIISALFRWISCFEELRHISRTALLVQGAMQRRQRAAGWRRLVAHAAHSVQGRVGLGWLRCATAVATRGRARSLSLQAGAEAVHEGERRRRLVRRWRTWVAAMAALKRQLHAIRRLRLSRSAAAAWTAWLEFALARAASMATARHVLLMLQSLSLIHI